MLRSLVVLLLGLNIALFFWIRANPTWGEADREPQRLQRQVSPAAIQVLPDLPASAAAPRAPVIPASGAELDFAPPGAGPVAAPAASAALPELRPASAPALRPGVALHRPSGATPGRGGGSR
jgi:hypothetical protein